MFQPGRHQFHGCKIMDKVMEWLKDTADMIYRELEVNQVVDYVRQEFDDLVTSFHGSWGLTFADALDQKY